MYILFAVGLIAKAKEKKRLIEYRLNISCITGKYNLLDL